MNCYWNSHHHLYQWWFIYNWTFGNKFQLNYHWDIEQFWNKKMDFEMSWKTGSIFVSVSMCRQKNHLLRHCLHTDQMEYHVYKPFFMHSQLIDMELRPPILYYKISQHNILVLEIGFAITFSSMVKRIHLVDLYVPMVRKKFCIPLHFRLLLKKVKVGRFEIHMQTNYCIS